MTQGVLLDPKPYPALRQSSEAALFRAYRAGGPTFEASDAVPDRWPCACGEDFVLRPLDDAEGAYGRHVRTIRHAAWRAATRSMR